MTNANQTSTQKDSWTEQIEVAAGQLYEQVKQLLNDGNVRRLVIRRENDAILLDVPLAAGAIGLGISLLILPHILAIVAVSALIAKFRVEVTREEAPVNEQDVQQIQIEEPTEEK